MERQYPKEYGPVTLRQAENEGGKDIPFQIIYETGGTPDKPISMEELLTFPGVGREPNPPEAAGSEDAEVSR